MIQALKDPESVPDPEMIEISYIIPVIAHANVSGLGSAVNLGQWEIHLGKNLIRAMAISGVFIKTNLQPILRTFTEDG